MLKILEDVVFYKDKFVVKFYVSDIYGWCLLVFGVVSYKLMKEGKIGKVRILMYRIYLMLGLYGKLVRYFYMNLFE